MFMRDKAIKKLEELKKQRVMHEKNFNDLISENSKIISYIF